MYAHTELPPYTKYWSEDGVVKPKHVARTMYIDYILMLCCD
jgi:hypothetical protein